MAVAPQKSSAKSSFESLARASAEAGRLDLAERYWSEACRRSPRDGGLRLELGRMLEARGAVGDALVAYSKAVALKRDSAEAVARLSALASRLRLDDPKDLDADGLLAALAAPLGDREALAETALHFLKTTTRLGEALKAPDRGVSLIGREASRLLGEPLLLAALATGINTDLEIERSMEAIRRHVATSLAPERASDRTLMSFLLALAAQANNNGYVWPVSVTETDALAQLRVDRAKLLAGDVAAGYALLVHMLYAPADQLLDGLDDGANARAIRPKALAHLVAAQLEARADERALAASIERLSPIKEATSARVQAQYEAAPYPRWTSIVRPNAGEFRARLAQFLPADRAAISAGPLRVLIAGCGTGQHAALAALGYGADAEIVALDLSTASLAYARRMCTHMGLANIRFVQGDILDAKRLGGTFDIIESVGVLHHMTDPLAGWRALLLELAPRGAMLVGLYSTVSRRNIVALRESAGYPGPDCDDAAARTWRASLRDADTAVAGAELKTSKDFYALSAFRDLALHQSEQRMTLAGIEAFLAAEKLAFRGFSLPPAGRALFAKAYPLAPWPGKLGEWAELEAANPSLFDGMYQLWCTRAD